MDNLPGAGISSEKHVRVRWHMCPMLNDAPRTWVAAARGSLPRCQGAAAHSACHGHVAAPHAACAATAGRQTCAAARTAAAGCCSRHWVLAGAEAVHDWPSLAAPPFRHKRQPARAAIECSTHAPVMPLPVTRVVPPARMPTTTVVSTMLRCPTVSAVWWLVAIEAAVLAWRRQVAPVPAVKGWRAPAVAPTIAVLVQRWAPAFPAATTVSALRLPRTRGAPASLILIPGPRLRGCRRAARPVRMGGVLGDCGGRCQRGELTQVEPPRLLPRCRLRLHGWTALACPAGFLHQG